MIPESYCKLAAHALKRVDRKRHCADTNRNHRESVKSDYESQLPWIESRQSEAIFQEDDSLGPAADVRSIVQKDNDEISEIISIFVPEFSNTLL